MALCRTQAAWDMGSRSSEHDRRVFDEDIVRGYWEHWRRSRGNREDRLEAEEGSRSHDLVDAAVRAGEPSVIDLLVDLAEAAPSDDDARLVGAGPLEELLSVHRGRLAVAEGAALVEAIDAAARHSPRFRRALGSVHMGDEIPAFVRARLGRFRAEQPP